MSLGPTYKLRTGLSQGFSQILSVLTRATDTNIKLCTCMDSRVVCNIKHRSYSHCQHFIQGKASDCQRFNLRVNFFVNNKWNLPPLITEQSICKISWKGIFRWPLILSAVILHGLYIISARDNIFLYAIVKSALRCEMKQDKIYHISLILQQICFHSQRGKHFFSERKPF